jgi:hypothetical protein
VAVALGLPHPDCLLQSVEDELALALHVLLAVVLLHQLPQAGLQPDERDVAVEALLLVVQDVRLQPLPHALPHRLRQLQILQRLLETGVLALYAVVVLS